MVQCSQIMGLVRIITMEMLCFLAGLFFYRRGTCCKVLTSPLLEAFFLISGHQFYVLVDGFEGRTAVSFVMVISADFPLLRLAASDFCAISGVRIPSSVGLSFLVGTFTTSNSENSSVIRLIFHCLFLSYPKFSCEIRCLDFRVSVGLCV